MPEQTLAQPVEKAAAVATGERFALVYGMVLAGVYLVLGIWSAVTGQWHHGALLWPDAGPQAEAWQQGLSLVLVIGWLVYALAWPVRAVRPWVWVALGVVQVPVLLIAGLWLSAIGALVFHVLAFDPRWLKRVVPTTPEPLFYDGYCGLCHRWVKLVMHTDTDGKLFFFSPLQGEMIKGILTDEERNSLPDSIVVRTNDGKILCKTQAVAHILTALGGWHRLGAILMKLIPGPIRNLGYDAVAKVRHKVFAKPSEACPMMPEHLRSRFRF